MTYDSALNKMAERIADRTSESKQGQLQRRNQVVDIYGMEFTRQGDTNHPATFYISVSPDLIYYERFEFKIIVQPFAMPIGADGATGSTTVQVNETGLTVNQNTISPNPHKHTTLPHNHPLSAGVSLFTSSVSDFEVWIEGIDVTPYLKAQYNGDWIDGEGVFPVKGLSNYDLLKAVGFMPTWQRGAILTPGYKKVELKGTGVFNATLVNYLKYSHVNR
ncbi:hypothetical protein [Enterococcus caccae]|uniref:Uncharacterized protein n=1 Tax=Enterococcus caccae ATCC BAA-1240 TaxID=1158612 RepID=R3WS15_9ENTE|nr:hypothetical protein [Enterococcus caccae]EOL50651.1 hypothetical protein UC7_00102 [Enterococcus caccae ATCC BAA-1240]EOT59456.1 hypothetical protein I580_02488 [Enterococcus caccae ATCC BAA-1240]